MSIIVISNDDKILNSFQNKGLKTVHSDVKFIDIDK